MLTNKLDDNKSLQLIALKLRVKINNKVFLTLKKTLLKNFTLN